MWEWYTTPFGSALLYVLSGIVLAKTDLHLIIGCLLGGLSSLSCPISQIAPEAESMVLALVCIMMASSKRKNP